MVYSGRQVETCALDYRIKKCETQIGDFPQGNFLFSSWGETDQSLGGFLPRTTQLPSIMNTKLDSVEIPRWSVPKFRKSQFNRSARKCPDQNPTQLRMIYTNILPIPPPRTRWKMAPYKVAIRPPKINVGKVIGSQFTRWKLVCQRR